MSFDALLQAFLEPLTRLTDPSKRIFWPFLLGGLSLAVVVAVARRQPVLPFLFPIRIFLHRSAWLDCKLLFAKALIRVFLVVPWMWSVLGVTIWVVSVLRDTFGEAPNVHCAQWLVSITYTVILFIGWDLSRYLLHRLLHEVPLLWEFHKVHHSAQVLTPLTLYRSHPIESILYTIRGVLVTGVITGLFFYIFGERAVVYELAGVNALGFVFNLAGANLRHSHVWLSYGPWWERLLVSPAQHQIHHSRASQDWGSNYGSWLAIWDWMFGTLRPAGRRRTLRFGLPRRVLNHHCNLTSALLRPFVAAARCAWSTSVSLPLKMQHDTDHR